MKFFVSQILIQTCQHINARLDLIFVTIKVTTVFEARKE